jgi:hypothetical protein
MKRLIIFSIVSLIVSACGGGSPVPGALAPKAGANQPGGAAVGKWDGNTYQAATSYCAADGDSSFSYQQWYQFCGCVYTAAAQQWTFDDFSTNFDAYYQLLATQGNPPVITNCLNQAGMSSLSATGVVVQQDTASQQQALQSYLINQQQQ